MALIKCKMCGGDLRIEEGLTVAECEYCGSKQTVPSADNEKKLTLFSRANRLRLGCEFDKAAGVYENIVAEFPTEAEAYWGLVLCRYGIEYVDDPADGKKVPTCHRSSFDSILEDSDFEQACENADAAARRLYREEAKAIEEIRKGVLEVSGKEKPYDIFICYKETDENGERTVDSVLAQDVYDALTEKGYRVFFSRITLEDRLGSEYEPYIFAALNSAKIMLAFGTDYEYYNAVWVKNEWSRYLKLMEKDKSKYLIPCYKGIDAYDMPKEFARLQAQDLGKVGAIQDLLRGIEKIIPREKPVTVVQEKVVVGGSGNNKIASLLDRGNMALEDGDWKKADSFFEDVLNNDSKNAQAYLGKTLALNQCRTIDAFVRQRKELSKNVRGETLKLEEETEHIEEAVNRFCMPNYIKESKIRDLYQFDLSYYSDVSERVQQYKNEEKYWADHKQLSRAEKFAAGAVAENLAGEKKALFAALNDRVKKAKTEEQAAIKDVQEKYAEHIKAADAKAEALYQQKEQQRDTDYKKYLEIAKNSSQSSELDSAAEFFEKLGEYQDSKKLAEHCRKRSAEEKEKQAALEKKEKQARAKRKKKIGIISGIAAAAAVVVILVTTQVVIPNNKYQKAVALMESAKYEEAITAFEELNEYKDSPDQILQCKYNLAVKMKESGDDAKAALAFAACADYSDAKEQSLDLWDEIAQRETVSTGGNHTVGLKSDGTVVAVGSNYIDNCDVSDWTDIVAISAGDRYTVGLKSDGTVVAVGDNHDGQCDVSDWTDIAAIATGDWHRYTVGLKSDGTVVAVGDNYDGQCEVSDWIDIVAISANSSLRSAQTVGLKSDGTVVAVGDNKFGQCDVSAWKDIVAISVGDKHTVGLKSDGTVVAVGDNEYGQCEVSDWTDIKLP